MILTELQVGVPAFISAVTAPAALMLRIRELGLRPGVSIQISHRAPFGARVLEVGDSRLALDAATCAYVTVVG